MAQKLSDWGRKRLSEGARINRWLINTGLTWDDVEKHLKNYSVMVKDETLPIPADVPGHVCPLCLEYRKISKDMKLMNVCCSESRRIGSKYKSKWVCDCGNIEYNTKTAKEIVRENEKDGTVRKS